MCNELELFNSGIHSFYKYIIAWSNKYGNGDSFYSREDFAEKFYSAVLDNEELPPDICAWAKRYYKNSTHKEVTAEFITALKSKIKSSKALREFQEKIKKMSVIRNEEETSEIRKILAHSCIPGVYDNVAPLIEYAKNNNHGLVWLSIDMFTYGYIMGKRAERAKRKNRKEQNYE